MSVTELHPNPGSDDRRTLGRAGQVKRPRRQRSTRLLSAAEEIALAKRIERGDLRAKERMIESNWRLVLAVARTYRHGGVPFDDLVQEGTVGLVRAVEKFDIRRELKFSTYAVWWIRCSIGDAIASSNVIRMPTGASRQLAAVRRAEAELERAGARSSDAAVAERTRLSVTTVRSLRGAGAGYRLARCAGWRGLHAARRLDE